MKTVRKMSPDQYLLSALSPVEKLEAALALSQKAFKGTQIVPEDIQEAVAQVRRRLYGARQKKARGRR